MLGRGLYAKLATHMIEEADHVARQRQQNAIAEGRTPGNHLAAGPHDLDLHIVGARGERAGKVMLDPIEWHKFKIGNLDGLPDLDDFIDIKTVSNDQHALLVPAHKIVSAWAYVLVSAAEHPYYWIAGWMWGHELAQPQHLRFPDRPAYSVATARLHKPYLLQDIVSYARKHNL